MLVDFGFIYIMRYNKQPIDFSDQIALLNGRGTIFTDEGKLRPLNRLLLDFVGMGGDERFP